jgi:hypothetical protein
MDAYEGMPKSMAGGKRKEMEIGTTQVLNLVESQVLGP